MNKMKMMNAYANSEREAVVESENPHALIALMLDELLRSMRVFSDNLAGEKVDLAVRGKHFSRSLTIIYALQSSLNFEQGGDIADNLFRLYEFARQQILGAAKTEDAKGVLAAITSLQDIRDAWQSVGETGK